MNAPRLQLLATRIPIALFAGTAAIALSLLAAAPASAAHPCGAVQAGQEHPARIATVRVSCKTGLEVALAAYEQIGEGTHATHYKVERFSCSAVLAETELSCRHHDEWIFASTQPADHPSEWHPPRSATRHPYWRHCAPIAEAISGDMLAHRVSCAKGRKLIRKVLRESQTAQRPHLHALGYTCALRPSASRPIACHKGGRRVLSPLAG